MGFWSKLFGKNKGKKYEIEESSEQEKYLKEDFDEQKMQPRKKAAAIAEEKIESEKYEDFSEFLETLEDKYGFNLNCCSWMSCEVLSERSY